MATDGKPLIVTAAQVVDGTGREPIRDGFVLIEGGLIQAAGRREELGSRVEVADRLDFPRATLLPGLIDCHSHLVLWGDGGIPFATIQQEPAELLLLRAAHNARLALEHGVTTLQDLGGRGGVTFALRRGIELGYVAGPRLLLAGRPVTTTGGHCWYFGGEADGVEGVRQLVRELVKEGADTIKVMTTGGGTPGTDSYRTYFTPSELQTAVTEAHQAGKRTAAHCTALQGIVNALDAGFDLLVHAAFYQPDGSYRFDERVAMRIVESGAFVNPTMHVTRTRIWGYKQRHPEMGEQERAELAKIEAYYQAKIDAIGTLYRMGAKIVAGSDAGWADYKFGDFSLELDALTEAGLSPMEAIVAGTSRAAECLGIADRVGTIEPGREADLLIVAGDPLADLRALQDVVAVFKRGHLLRSEGGSTRVEPA